MIVFYVNLLNSYVTLNSGVIFTRAHSTFPDRNKGLLVV